MSTALVYALLTLGWATWVRGHADNVPRALGPESIRGYYLKNAADGLAEEFERAKVEELGIPFVKKLYKKFKYVAGVHDAAKSVDRIAGGVETKLNATLSLLADTKALIEAYDDAQKPGWYSAAAPCLINGTAAFDVFNFKFSPSLEQLRNASYIFKNEESNLGRLKSAVKRRYFLSTEDVFERPSTPIDGCNVHDNSLLWTTYLSRVRYPGRQIMLLLDNGGSLSAHQFHLVKAVAKQVISTLTDEDSVALMAISDDWSAPYAIDRCLAPSQVQLSGDLHMVSPANDHTKAVLNKFIDSLGKGNGITNHTLGLQQALTLIKNSNLMAGTSVMLLYISRGLLSTLTEEKTVLNTLAGLINRLDQNVSINTCAVIDETKPVMYEMHFLRDVADQNYTKYNISVGKNVKKGLMLTVNSTQAIGFAVAKFYNALCEPVFETTPEIALPAWDHFSKDLTISVVVTCGKHGKIGVLGADLYFSNIAEDIAYYSSHQNYAYAFLATTNGVTIVHPSYPRPDYAKTQPKFADVALLEKLEDRPQLREKILTHPRGDEISSYSGERRRYVWRRVLDWYVVCVVVFEDVQPPSRPVSRFSNSASSQLVHHRLDVVPTLNLCRHLNQIATLNAGSLYLSASCFQSPSAQSALAGPLSLNIQNYMAYLKDKTRLLANPGLKEEVRDDVAALAYVLEFFRNQHLTGAKAKFIVRRYVASYTGVLEMFPGSVISPGFDPSRRTWFLSATERKDLVILTPPYLDAGGAGYIVTIAYATQHAVMALDVTYGYVYKLLLERMPFCSDRHIKCFLMDNRGYLVYHPNLIDPNGHGPIEQQHIIHKESLVANDILSHENFVKKMLCNNYADSTIQRYYNLNTGLTDVLSNAVHGEHCVRYQVSSVTNTNVFIGVVNATCEVVATFCPCSMVDRLCLNCNRMEQKECECPCECPLNLGTCHHPNKTFTKNPICPATPEQSLSMPDQLQPRAELKPCMPFVCESHLTYSSCLGVTGCEWCRFEADGESLLPNPFCTTLSTCFNGVLGSVTPYGDATNEITSTQDLLGPPYSPVGPVTGSVIAMCILLTLLFFCYRSYTSPSVERFYLAATQDNQVQMSDLNINDDYHEADSHQDKLLKENNRPGPISPYCISSTYRRPVTAADSDHGYSTMTPHDESEHLSFAPLEIDSLEDECVSDNASVNTSVSGKPALTIKNKKLNLERTTALPPQRKYIMAPVTVHRNMEIIQ